ncbi:subtilisin-like protease [Phyllosticta citribraziliensis]|uniref:Subtilisin-like protease n=1 Tax=Phyllosticta citribraziliensis TaxID=989973 RepID=A0ABR1LXL8_9PEZI
MKTSTVFALNLLAGVLAAPTPSTEATKEFDVLIAPGADIPTLLTSINLQLNLDDIFATFNNSIFHGFSGPITSQGAESLAGLDQVLAISEVVPIHANDVRSSAPWGLQRISQSGAVDQSGKSATDRSYTYTYSDSNLGSGVDVYVLDTGILTSHTEFGGRASMGYSYFPSDADGNGHGTHCAGVIGGSTVGIASKANIIGVKILQDSGSGSSSGLLAGLDYVSGKVSSGSSVGSIINMSLAFSGTSTAVETALKKLMAAGVHAVGASGNNAGDACTYSPANMGGDNTALNTVGAMNIGDSISSFSNTGSCVDFYAPGEAVVSSYNNGDDAYVIMSGTSMATPHVAGLIAYYLAEDSSLKAPADMKAFLKKKAASGLGTGDDKTYVAGGELLIANNGGN